MRAVARGGRILTWSKAASNVRADGFKPNIEAIGDRAPQMKSIANALPGMASQANILALCEKGSLQPMWSAPGDAKAVKDLGFDGLKLGAPPADLGAGHHPLAAVR